MGFTAYHKLTGEPHDYYVKISKQIGHSKLHIILLNEHEPVDYTHDLNEALDKAHKYFLNKILNDDVLDPLDEVYNNLLDTTKQGKKYFETNFHKANLSEEKVNIPGHPAP